jgi:hypothetical protein
MTIARWRHGETVTIIERAVPLGGAPIDISAVVGLPEMVVRPANRERTGPAPDVPAVATATAEFEAAAGAEPPRWVFTFPSDSLLPGFYALNSSYDLGSSRMKTEVLIIQIEESAA